MTTEEYVRDALENKKASPVRRNQFNLSQSSSPVKKSQFESSFGSNFTSKFGVNPDLDTSDGLYRLAEQAGLKDKADKILRDNSGEDVNKIFSGGFISDTFDVLNMLSYGTVGLLKGKTFEEGVKNRESFSDKDSLGKYGWGGIGAGLVLDIVTDPLTYIAPWTLAKKIPGVTRVGSLFKDAIVGREVTKLAEGAEQAYTALEGGVMNGKARELIQKVSYMFGADPVFKEGYDRMQAMIGKETTQMMGMVRQLSTIDPKVSTELLTRDETGRFARRSLDDLQRTLSTEDYAKVEPIWNTIDELGKRMVDLGLLGKDKYEENLGKYIKSVYSQHELAKKKGLFGFKSIGVKGEKARKADLTQESMEKLGQIDDPAYITGRTMEHMIHDIHNAEFLNKVSKFASDVEFEGSIKVPDSRRFITTQGSTAQAAQGIRELNTQITPLLKQLKATFKADGAVLREIKSIEKDLGRMSTLQGDELNRFFSDVGKPSEVVAKPRTVRIIPERLQVMADKVKKFDSFEEMISSRTGIQLESLWHDGVLQRNGFPGEEKALRNFFDTAKNTYTPAGTRVTKEIKSIQKQVDELGAKLNKNAGKELSAIQRKEQAKFQKAYDDAVARLEKLKKKGTKVSKTSDLSTMDKLSRIDEVMKNTKLGKEAFKEMEKLKSKLASAQKLIGAEKERLLKEVDDALAKYETQLVDVKTTKLVDLQKRIESLTAKSDTLKDIDKTSINDSFRFLEDRINNMRLDKDDLIDVIHNNKMAGLAGKYIPKEMFDYIDDMINPTEAFGNRIISEFKYMKVVLNPGTHVRNMLSNKILNWWKLGIGPWNVKLDTDAFLELKNHGKYWNEWTSVGGGADTYAAAELKSILQQPETTFLKGKLGNYWTKAKQKMGDIYQSEEAHAKMSAFIAMRQKGHSIEEAYKMSQSATFNYAQVTPFIKKMRTAIWGMPFITFAVKSAPVVVETIGKNPGRVSVFGKIRNDIKNASDIQETQEEAESEPAWIKEGFNFKLPYKDEHGRSMYFDLTYILPFGDIVTGGIFSQPVSRTTGTKEALPLSVASNNPVFQVLKELTRNETFTGEQIFKASDSTEQVSADIFYHIARTFSPPWVAANLPGGYSKSDGTRVNKGLANTDTASKENQARTTQQEMFAYLGLKVQPTVAEINDSYQEWNKKKGLQTLLLENNVIENFSRNYIPKEDVMQFNQ